jgi:hypothetical protein
MNGSMNENEFIVIRNRLERGFRPSSAGYCAATAIILNVLYGASFYSTYIDGVSHWVSRLDGFDIDLTGDQFGFDKIQIVKAGYLYPNLQKREKYHIRKDTAYKAYDLAVRCNMIAVSQILRRDFL